MQTVVITAGRNVGTEPMSDGRWSELRSDLVQALQSVNAEIYTRDAIGRGEWIESSGRVISEESITYVGAIEAATLEALERNISRVASKYLQDAIALVVGQSLLVKGI